MAVPRRISADDLHEAVDALMSETIASLVGHEEQERIERVADWLKSLEARARQRERALVTG